MPRISGRSLASLGSAAFYCVAALACGDGLGGALVENVVDTVTLYAVRNTAIRLPSGYSILDRAPIRTETTSDFDFAFDIDANGAALVYPAGALGLPASPGLQTVDRSFEQVTSAPTETYTVDHALVVTVGQVFVARSRTSANLCVFFVAPRYAKFRVMDIDAAARSITMELLVNLNCGFRNLEPGLPSS